MARFLFLNLVLCVAVQSGFSTALDETKPPRHLKWPTRTIKVSISSSLFGSSMAIKPESDVNSAVLNALQRWEDAANVEFKIAITESASISPPGVSGDGVSLITIAPETENIAAFSQKTQNASGLTRVFYDVRGAITEADIALNPLQLFTTDKTPGAFDLEAVLTHEIGHLLGLAHSADPSSVMFDGVPRNGSLDLPASARTLSADDKTKIRRLYGSDRNDENCCVRIKGRVDNTDTGPNNYVVWVQEVRSGALVEVALTANKGFEFGPLLRGNYEVFAQNRPISGALFGADGPVVKDAQTNQNINLFEVSRPVNFDLLAIGLNGEMSRRAVNVQAGNTYRLVIGGPGVNQPELQFGTTSGHIALESIKSETRTGSKGSNQRAFRLTVSGSVRSGQYSVFAEDLNGARRYLVGAISVN